MDHQLNRQLAEFARAAQGDDEVSDAARRLCDLAVAVSGPDCQAGLTLTHRRQAVETAAATSEQVRRGDELQYELREGPCLTAAWREEQVYIADLDNDPRWPTWGPRARKTLDVSSMLCTRLFTHGQTVGALNIYSPEVDGFTDEDREDIRLVAAHGAVAVAATQQAANLKLAIDRRTTTGQAIGIIMERYSLSDQQAFSVLHRLSQELNTKLYDIARDLIRSGKLPDAP